MSLAEITYFGWSFASLTLLRKVEEEPQLLVIFISLGILVFWLLCSNLLHPFVDKGFEMEEVSLKASLEH